MARRGPKRPQDLKDWHLWSEVTRSVDPLRKPPVKARELAAPKDPATEFEAKKPPRSFVPQATPRFTSPPYTPPGTSVQPHNNASIDPKTKRRLARGHLRIDATIDLHGMRQSEAHAALGRFVAARHARGDRTVLIITGKGLKKTGFGMIEQRGVLRHMLPLWLNEPRLKPLISGYESAHQSHGGEGAWYVRLKRFVK